MCICNLFFIFILLLGRLCYFSHLRMAPGVVPEIFYDTLLPRQL